jgi:hypothetical protein
MATWDRYTGKTTGFKLQVLKEGNFTSRSYCDDVDATDVYTSKPPVAMLTMTPIVQFVNTNVTWDVSDSRHPTGTIDTYDLNFGDGVLAEITGASWAGAKSGTVQYTVPGFWNAALSVTDTLGITSAVAVVQVQIIEFAPGIFYTGTTDAGAFLTDVNGDAAAINTGLTGDWLKIRSLRMTPIFRYLPQTQQHLWIATAAGVAYSANGGTSWTLITLAAMGEPNGATTETSADLDCIDIAFNPADWKTVAAYRAVSGGGIWVYITADYGTTWNNYKVII